MVRDASQDCASPLDTTPCVSTTRRWKPSNGVSPGAQSLLSSPAGVGYSLGSTAPAQDCSVGKSRGVGVPCLRDMALRCAQLSRLRFVSVPLQQATFTEGLFRTKRRSLFDRALVVSETLCASSMTRRSGARRSSRSVFLLPESSVNATTWSTGRPG